MSDGSVPYGDHNFKRAAGRVQVRDEHSQTDIFAGVQKKFFGWPNFFATFGSSSAAVAASKKPAKDADSLWAAIDATANVGF